MESSEPVLVRALEVGPAEYGDYAREWEADGGLIVPGASARKGRSFAQMQAAWRDGETDLAYAVGFVPNTLYFLVTPDLPGSGRRILGALSLRHVLNDRLLVNGGHIGYGVRPSERRRGWARRMLTLGLAAAAGKGITKALVTCDEDNLGSRRTIEGCGGVLENQVEVEGVLTRRYWITISAASAAVTQAP